VNFVKRLFMTTHRSMPKTATALRSTQFLSTAAYTRWASLISTVGSMIAASEAGSGRIQPLQPTAAVTLEVAADEGTSFQVTLELGTVIVRLTKN
jgi:hypothetical protein